ncbi:MAG: hypothetical protein H6721_30625 [Sandaracinus sp.]|nr:hypothetical protein [Myxococcales bacterium]MCB9636486.1 hypothetical protein [Sandaracinus sp.]
MNVEGEFEWSAIRHAYGPATDLPELLDLLSRGESVVEVRNDLWGCLVHQSTRYQASVVVVPVLFRLLRNGLPSADATSCALELLRALALGNPADAFPTRPEPDLWLAGLEVDGEILALERAYGTMPVRTLEDAVVRVDAHWARRAYVEVERGLDDVLPYLRHSDAELALHALTLVSDFPRRAGDLAPHLRSLAVSDSRNAGAAVLGLVRLGEDVSRLAPPLVAAEDAVTRLYAASALALGNAPMDDSVVAELTRPLGALNAQQEPFANSLGAVVAAAVERLPAAHRERAIRALADLHRDVHPIETLQRTPPLLRLAFPEGAPSSADVLDELQRFALESVVALGGWSLSAHGAPFGDYLEILHGFGLPTPRRALEAWLRGEM